MNKQTARLLEQHFDTAFAAPDGIAKLRELILTLAMQGRLVEQDPSDPPASELLKEIQAEKQRLVKAGKIKKPKPLPPIKPEEVPYELPKGWEWVRLIDIGLWAIGSGLPHSIQGDCEQEILLCKVSDMNLPGNEKFIFYANNTVSEKTAQHNKLNISEPRTIIFPKIGGAIATNKRRILQKKTVIDNNCLGITPSFAMNLEWCYQLLLSFDFAKYQTGTSVPAISQRNIGEIVIGIPPASEQNRIVTRIEQLMARCDELEKLRKEREEKRLAIHAAAINQLLDAPDGAAWNFIQQHFDELYTIKENVAELRKAILQLAVMGRLVPQNPDDPPTSELLKEIKVEKQRLVKAGKIKKSKPLPPIKPEEVPFELPRGWEWVRLGEVGITQTGTTPPRKDRENYGNFIPFVGPGNIKSSTIDYSGEGLSERGLAKGRLINAESVLMVCIGGSIGKHAINERDTTCNQQINTLTPYNPVPVKYIYYVMDAVYFQNAVINQASGSATPIINKQKWSAIPVPIPSLPEQHRIFARIDQLMNLCDMLVDQINTASNKQNELLSAVMAHI
jgi:type I restriction enzyme, S subunit